LKYHALPFPSAFKIASPSKEVRISFCIVPFLTSASLYIIGGKDDNTGHGETTDHRAS